jgi:hypothetical protein
MSLGLEMAGFDVTAVDVRDLARYHRSGRFVQADALTFPLEGFDFVHASPPCQSYSSLRHLHSGREYPDLIEPIRERLRAWGGPWSIENVPGAPLGGAYLVMLCGTMFGLQTPDGRAEIRRHRLFELSFCPDRKAPPCRHGGGQVDERQAHLFGESAAAPYTALGVNGTGQQPVGGRATQREVLTVTGTHGLPGIGVRELARRRALSVTGHAAEISPSNWPIMERQFLITAPESRKVLTVTGHTPVDNTGRLVICVAGGKAMSGGMSEPQGARKRRAVSVTGGTPQTNTVHNISRETFSVDDARAAMGIDWLPMKLLSQAIPPVYGEWIGRQAIAHLEATGAFRRAARG